MSTPHPLFEAGNSASSCRAIASISCVACGTVNPGFTRAITLAMWFERSSCARSMRKGVMNSDVVGTLSVAMTPTSV